MMVLVINVKLGMLGISFGMKRIEILKESLKKDNFFVDDYIKLFKWFVGGKEVVKGFKEIKELLLSVEVDGDFGGYLYDVGFKEMFERVGSIDRIERIGDMVGEVGGIGGVGVEVKMDRRNIVVFL